MPDVPMPRLSDSMEEGTILKWLKADGEAVRAGDELLEIETDKANTTFEAQADGVLTIVAREGETLAVGAVIARIAEEASENGAGAEREAKPATPRETGTAKGTVETVEPTRLQQTVARRMAESKATAPDFALAAEADMEEAAALCERLEAVAGDADAVPSLEDLVVKAAAVALREFPQANGAYRDGRFELHSRVNVGVAMAAQEALVVPTLFDADAKSLGRIAAETRALAERVRSGAVTPPELSGGTFTVSNLGTYGVRRVTPVLNPPQAAVLGVGATEPRAVVVNGRVTVRRRADLTLVCDHRILYGAGAARFLARIVELLEQPLRLTL